MAPSRRWPVPSLELAPRGAGSWHHAAQPQRGARQPRSAAVREPRLRVYDRCWRRRDDGSGTRWAAMMLLDLGLAASIAVTNLKLAILPRRATFSGCAEVHSRILAWGMLLA